MKRSNVLFRPFIGRMIEGDLRDALYVVKSFITYPENISRQVQYFKYLSPLLPCDAAYFKDVHEVGIKAERCIADIIVSSVIHKFNLLIAGIVAQKLVATYVQRAFEKRSIITERRNGFIGKVNRKHIIF